MRRLAILLPVVVLAIGACSSDRSKPAATHRSSTTTRPAASTSSTAPPPPDLNAAQIKLTKIAEPTQGTAIAFRAGDAAAYITEQAGVVRAVRDGKLQDTPVLDLHNTVGSGGERGLLGLTFSRDGARLYVDYTNRNGDTRIDEYTMRADGTADVASKRELLAIAQPQANHNGGNIVIGSDDMLWIGMGDGGAGGDQGTGHASGGNGQSRETLLGKLLRIDPTPGGGRQYSIPPDNPFAAGGGRAEIWAYGLRNPWRFSFDALTGDLWIGDVGQGAWEEVDFMPKGRGAGANYGWNVFEGSHRFRSGEIPDAVMPITEYSHDTGGTAITGGYVYRGSAIPNLVGAYVYSDSGDGKLRAITQLGGSVGIQRDLGVTGGAVVAFGQDAKGEIYVLSQTEGLMRIDPA